MTTTEQFADGFKKTRMEEAADHRVLVMEEMEFLLASRPETLEDFGVESPMEWMMKYGKLFKKIIGENPSWIDEFEAVDPKNHEDVLSKLEEEVKAKLLH